MSLNVRRTYSRKQCGSSTPPSRKDNLRMGVVEGCVKRKDTSKSGLNRNQPLPHQKQSSILGRHHVWNHAECEKSEAGQTRFLEKYNWTKKPQRLSSRNPRMTRQRTQRGRQSTFYGQWPPIFFFFCPLRFCSFPIVIWPLHVRLVFTKFTCRTSVQQMTWQHPTHPQQNKKKRRKRCGRQRQRQ